MSSITTINHPMKKSSKTISEEEIDLPVGVTLKKQEKKHKFFSKIFSSISKSKYKKAIEATNNKKFVNSFDTEKTLHQSDLYDTEKTIYDNDLTYIKGSISENHDDSQNTISTVYSSKDYSKNPIQAFLSRKTVNLKGRNEDTLPVLNDDLAEIIRCRLPNLLQEATTWKLLYSMNQHGATLSTLYRKIKNQGPCIIVLKSSEDEIFGAFITEAFDPSNKGFFGTPECFLWKADKYQFKKFSATHINQYFMVAESNFIAMGGGNGNFGFYLDEDIQFGYTSKCDTFENETLTKDNEFECYGCEIWGLEF
ncbi:TLD-domain-containing protein [Piromyces finnis]|uniref:Oxidation resistance protein 1 n=1 Tax=Piromyces finnis TaxID=1754191 RepID=A0A1Y1VC74_9FUNG|nr:TLD-domain-containing protein [Piromyces finnis]|eukprot:ORX52072.1 TLD-domain-containing protein [Piromyces finnis]